MKEPKHIRILPVAVANKIAAGEVVERPASVVKEMMENSFDAGADRIVVEIASGGRKLISISDNGHGMEREDALLSLEMQATSKIFDVNDIEQISTYGFRGEAIPSIASVSRMTIKTAVEGAASGTIVEIEGGAIRNIGDIGFPRGTTFEVRDLFFNVPARRKFMRTIATEQAHIRSAFIFQALAHPEVAMKLIADGRELIDLAGGATLDERVHDLFGIDFLETLRKIDYQSPKVNISGFIALPTMTRSDRSEQYVFINRRAATANIVPYALREAYPPLAGDRKPIAILFIEVPPTEVDVNVHPTKREVRFRDGRSVRDAIILAVQKALGLGAFCGETAKSSENSESPNGGYAAFSSEFGEQSKEFISEHTESVQNNNSVLRTPYSELTSNSKLQTSNAPLTTPLSVADAGPCGGAFVNSEYGVQSKELISTHGETVQKNNSELRTPNSELTNNSELRTPNSELTNNSELRTPNSELNIPVPLPSFDEATSQPSSNSELRTPNSELTSNSKLQTSNSIWSWCRILGQIAGGYIIAETDGGYAVLDPRACHERVIFDRMLASSKGDTALSQPLLLPESITLPPEDAARIAENIELIRRLGIGLDTFGGCSFVCDALPQGIKLNDLRGFLTDISVAIAESGSKKTAENIRIKAIAAAASASAVSRMTALPYQALSQLVEDISISPMPYTSPTGRPTMIFTSTRELERKFSRK